MIDLSNKEQLINFLKENSLYTQKKFGQNFLTNKQTLDSIIKTANIQKNDQIIEIGPGLGVLTERLIEKAKKVISIELDSNLIPILEKRFKDRKNLEIIQRDALKFIPPKTKYKVVANIPYNITSPLINHFLQANNPPLSMTLLIQKEVAEKICDTNKMSILSLQVALFANTKYIKTVPANAFYPEPKVKSAIIQLELIKKGENGFTEIKNANLILNLAKIAFSHKRKKLISTLIKKGGFKAEKLGKIFKKLKLNENIRPENLTIPDWKSLVTSL